MQSQIHSRCAHTSCSQRPHFSIRRTLSASRRPPAAVSVAKDGCGEQRINYVDVAVVGGGPAGLSAAIALRKVLPHGVSIAVYESRPDGTDNGAGLGIEVNGLRALDAIDPRLAHSVYERGTFAPGMNMCSFHTGHSLPAEQQRRPVIDRLAIFDSLGHCVVGMRWQGMVDLLKEHMEEGLLAYDTKLLSCEELDGAEGADSSNSSSGLPDEPYRYRLVFGERRAAAAGNSSSSSVDMSSSGGDSQARGGQAGPEDSASGFQAGLEVRAKVVVGADGYFSRVRRELVDGQTPSFTGNVAWWGVVYDEDMDRAGARWPAGLEVASESEAAGQTRWNVYMAEPPRILMGIRVVGGKSTWFFRCPAAKLQAIGLEFPGPSTGPEALSRALHLCPDLAPEVRQMLAATNPANVTERGLYMHDFDNMGQGSWTSGHVVLVGDAAHTAPPSGQGINVAFEDAAALAAAVRQHGLGPQAFQAFEASRMDRVRDILTDQVPPFARASALAPAISFEPLWSLSDLPAGAGQVGSVEEGLAWSRREARGILSRRLTELGLLTAQQQQQQSSVTVKAAA